MSKNKLKIKKLQGSDYGLSLDQKIDTASFSTVYRAYNLKDPRQQLAVKVISCKDEQGSKTIKSQIQAIKALPFHQNLVNCKKILISSEKNFYLIMQFCKDGNLEQYMYRNKFEIEQDKIWFFLKQFCQGYKVLHHANIIHRDLKPENILINNGDFKIADFGLSRKIQDLDILQNVSSKGTPLYMAPQLHLDKSANGQVDVFSLGIIIYRMAFNGKHPFYESGRNFRSVSEYFQQLMMKKIIIPQFHKRSKQLVELIKRMLSKENSQRIKWAQIFKIQNINKAVRGQRKKQLHPLEHFKRSIIIANRSFTEVKVIEENKQDSQNQQNTLIIEQTFNNPRKTSLEKKLYHYKLIYTIVSHTNIKIQAYLKEQIHPHLRKRLTKIIIRGFRFSLFLIKNLEEMSGDWNRINPSQIMNFQDIFQNDRLILLEDLKQFYTQIGKDPQTIVTKPYTHGEYEDSLYSYLSQFEQYPVVVKIRLNIITAFLIDIYDLVLKLNEKDISESTKGKIQFVENQSIDEFYNYLTKMQNVKLNDIQSQLEKKGLHIE